MKNRNSYETSMKAIAVSMIGIVIIVIISIIHTHVC
jgi:hypothetical protein